MPGSYGDAKSPGFSLELSPANLSPDGHPTPTSDTGGGLTGLLVDQVKGVNSMQTGADAMMNSLLTGGDVNEAEVLTAVQKADLAFRMLMQIRNKLMDAYREVQQIQI
nr:flagellar hook-basal body complex protein FliE [Rhodopirellula sallentina]